MKVRVSRQGFRSATLTLTLAVLVVAPASSGTDGSEPISDAALQQIQLLEDQKDARSPEQMKMSSQLVYTCEEARAGAAASGAPDMEADVAIEKDGRVLVDVTAVVSEDLLARIGDLGGEIVSSAAAFDAIRARLPIESLEVLAGNPAVRFIEPAAEGTTNTGSVTSEGDTTHRATQARTAFGINGTGVNIGVLSDSVDFLAASQALNDLGAVTVLTGQSGVGTCGGACTGEGTAMLELTADLVPGAALFFATGNGGPANMATNIAGLQAAGCNIIVDDLTYFNEPPFQDGPISQAVNAASAAGVMYFSSARNSGNQNDGTSSTWEGDFADGGAAGAPVTGAGRVHSFGASNFNTIVAGGSNRRVDLFWSDPLNGSANDYDLFVLDSTGTTVLRSSTNAQTGTQNAYESIGTLTCVAGANSGAACNNDSQCPGGSCGVGERLVIVQRAGAAGRFLHLDTGRARLSIATAGAVRGHNAAGAANAFSVAATNVGNSFPNAFSGGATNPIETFSSDGPRRIFFDASGNAITPGNFSATGGSPLQKPDITAADGNVTSAAVPGFNPFFGTSAAAPHAAAIAALLLSSTPGATAAQIRTALSSTALDIEAPGVDRDSGAGVVMAFQAIKALNPCTLTCPLPITRPNDVDQCGATVTYAQPTTTGLCGTITCAPSAGSFFPVGTTQVTCTSASQDSCSFNVKVNDTQPPAVTCSVGTSSLRPPNHALVGVEFQVSAKDNCAGSLPLTVQVSGDEDDETLTGDGNFSPDAASIGPGTLRLRAERKGDGDGRVYLTGSTAIDTAGNHSAACCNTVVVPHDMSARSVASVNAQAAAARTFCQSNGAAPPGYFVVGDGPVIGPKQ